MSECIELTSEEINTACAVVARSITQGKGYRDGIINAVEAINDLRNGEPLGTVRQSRSGSAFFQRIEDDNGRRCWLVFENPGAHYGSLTEKTELIYMPENHA